MNRMAEWTGHGWLSLPIRWYLGGLFVFASWHKMLYPGSFALDIATYDLLPLVLVNPMAIVLPYVEFLAGIMLIAGFRSRAATLLVIGILFLFTVALILALNKGLDVACGCFASQTLEQDPIRWSTVLRDLVWIVLSLYVLVFDRNAIGIDRWLRRG